MGSMSKEPYPSKTYQCPSNPFRGPDGVLVMAHRGGGGLMPENTLASFGHAIEMGADILETDIHTTRDGELVLIHDPYVDRVSDGDGLVSDFTLADLKKLDAGYLWSPDDGKSYPFRGKGLTIPTLAETLEAFPHIWVNIDIKSEDPAAALQLTQFIRAHGVAERMMVGSFWPPVLKAFRVACPEVQTSAHPREIMRFLVLHKLFLTALFRTPANVLQIPDVHKGFTVVTPRLIRAAHRRGLAVHVWTIDEPETMRNLIEWGVDAIITDYPDRLLALRE